MYLGAFSTRFPAKFATVPDVGLTSKSVYLESMKLTVAKTSIVPYKASTSNKRVTFRLTKPSIPLTVSPKLVL
jgi:hypothetical protein